MKKLFKFIFKFILFIVILVVVIVGGVLIAFTDKTDDSPDYKDYAEITTKTVLADQLNASLENLGTNYSMDLLFDEDNLNKLLYAFAKKLNENYDPSSSEASKDANKKYIRSYTIPEDISVVGGKSMGIKSIYGEVNAETKEVTINLTADIEEKIKTRVYFTFTVETTDTSYVLKISEIKLAKINLGGNLVKKAIESFDLVKMVNDFLAELPFTFAIEDSGYTLTSTKVEFNKWVNGLLGSDEASGTDMKTVFVNLLLDPEKSMVKFDMFNGKIGVKIDLEELRVDESATTLDESVKEEFNIEDSMAAKAQTLMINCLSSNTDMFLEFSELDMSKLIYTNMDGYKDLIIETELMDGVKFKFSVDGLTFDIDDNGQKLDINIILNVNGLKTTAVLTGDIDQDSSDEEVRIKLEDYIKLGKDLKISSDFIVDMLAQNFTTEAIMKFDKDTKSLVFTKELLNTMLKEAMGSTNSPLEVSKLEFVKDNLRIYVTADSTLTNQINQVTSLINDSLKAGLELDTTKFSAEDQAAVTEVQAELDKVSEKLTDGTLSSEDTDALMESVNGMSTEAQNAFFEQLGGSIDQTQLDSLYASMFK